MKLENLVAIVTGGSSGIGAGISTVLCSRGCKVVLANTNEELGKKMENSIGMDKAYFVKTDLNKEEDIKNLVSKTIEKFGAIHILINNSAVPSFGMLSSNDMFTLEEMIRVFRVNLFGPLLLSKYVSQQMLKQDPLNENNERGLIVHISSIGGTDGTKRLIIYSASKGALNAATLPMTSELGKFGIRVVGLAPGTFPTPMTEMVDQRVKDNHSKESALGRLGDPKEVGEAVASLIEDSYITGTIIRIDGGLRPRI